jgi:N-acetyl-beta-hexosaminidase
MTAAHMAAAKMNILHMHLSDDQRCSVDSITYPNLTGHLKNDPMMGGSYTHQDIKDIVKFANARGILGPSRATPAAAL